MDRLFDWIDRQNQKKADFPATILGRRVLDETAANDLLSELPVWTYRSDFDAPLPNSHLVGDRNWGCLIRTSQMLLARALQLHGEYRDEWFRDMPEAPFSIHAFVGAIAEPHKEFEAKYWAPSQGCEAIRRTVAKASLRNPLFVVVAENGSLCNEDLLFALKEHPLLVLMPVRTSSNERITQSNFMCIEHLLTSPCVVGIVGGVPRRSYFCIGTCEASQRIMFLDPHVKVQTAFKTTDDLGHCRESAATVPCVDWKRLDSCLVVGVYLRSAKELTEFTQHVSDPKVEDFMFLRVETHRQRGAARPRASVDDVITWDDSM